MEFQNALFASEVAVLSRSPARHTMQCSVVLCRIEQSLFKFKIHSIKLLFALELLLMTISFGVYRHSIFRFFPLIFFSTVSVFIFLFLSLSSSISVRLGIKWNTVVFRIQSFWVGHSFVWPFIECETMCIWKWDKEVGKVHDWVSERVSVWSSWKEERINR